MGPCKCQQMYLIIFSKTNNVLFIDDWLWKVSISSLETHSVNKHIMDAGNWLHDGYSILTKQINAEISSINILTYFHENESD